MEQGFFVCLIEICCDCHSYILMKYNKSIDIFLNVCLPLTIGAGFYWLKSHFVVPAFIKNYLADGLWAYALMSGMLIIWDRTIPILWLFLLMLVAVTFELFQHYNLIAGTGDIYDVVTYMLFYAVTLLLNHFFKSKL